MTELPAEPAVVFDNDGVIVDSEPLWVRARQELVRDAGGHWVPEADTAMMGISSDEWSAYMRDNLGIALSAGRIRAEVIRRMVALSTESVPFIDGARQAIEAIGARWRVGVASGSDRVLLDTVLATDGLGRHFAATVAGDEVPEGKPSPLIYAETCRRLGARPAACVAIEDSGSGIESALAAGMRVIAIPRAGFEPAAATLRAATVVLDSIAELKPDLVARVLPTPA